MTTDNGIEIHRGLNGVYFDRSTTCFIDGRAGKLLYRGYNIDDLAERSTFEETAYLLLHGKLPARTELTAVTYRPNAAMPVTTSAATIVCHDLSNAGWTAARGVLPLRTSSLRRSKNTM